MPQIAQYRMPAITWHLFERQEKGEGMIFFELLEWAFLVIFILFMVTQVVLPLWRDTPYLPFFRRQARALRIRKVLRVLEETDPDGQPREEDDTTGHRRHR